MSVAMHILQPSPGFYKYRAAKGAPWLPALVYEDRPRDPETGQAMDRVPALRCLIDGAEVDLDAVWTSLHPVGEAEYRAMCELWLDSNRVPDLGQEKARYNSHDAELKAAAQCAFDGWSPVWFRKVALLITQITEHEKRCEEDYKLAAAPVRAQLEQIRQEHQCEASEYKKALRQALTRYAESFGIPPCPETTPHWRDMPPQLEIEQDKVSRRYCSPDEAKIKAALARGEKVRGVRVVTRREIIVV